MTSARQPDPATLRPESRYGRPRLSRTARHRAVIALAVLALAGLIAVTVVAYQRLSNSDVSGSLAGYRIVDDETVAVTISVTRPDPSRPVDCIVRARSQDGDETGRREVLVGPSPDKTVQVTAPVKSVKPPFVGDIYGCGTEVPGYLQAQ